MRAGEISAAVVARCPSSRAAPGRSIRAGRAAGLALSLAFAAGAANAAIIVPVSAVGSTQFPGYFDDAAIDTGPGSELSDWATFGEGTGQGAFLRLDLGAVYALGAVNVVDRVTSGGANGMFNGGVGDYTNTFTIQAYSDAAFTNAIGPLFTFNKPTPTVPATMSDFAFTGALGGVSARYVQYTIIATDGNAPSDNAGLSNINFSTDTIPTGVPEPATWAMMILGFAGAGTVLRRRQPALRG